MNTNNNKVTYVGIDVAKHHLDIALLPDELTFQVKNNKSGIIEAIQKLRPYNIECIVVEATGRMENEFVAACDKKNLPIAIINPMRVRRFAQTLGIHAKTDRLDARVIAQFGQKIRPAIRQRESEITRQCNDLMTRRQQLLGLRTMEKNRLTIMPKPFHRGIKKSIACFDRQLTEIDVMLHKLIQKNEEWQQKQMLLQTVPGVGETLSNTLLSQLPELGQLNHKAIASLVGVAPMNRDSGNYRGHRSIRGGRADVRKVLYMATVAAIKNNKLIKHHYQQLKEKGKQSKVALVACMRKLIVILNAMMRDNVPWQYQ